MPTHVALLRGINVGGRNRVAMADLRDVVSSLGHTDVVTYIQSGNVVFTARKGDSAGIAAGLEAAIVAALGVKPAVVVMTKEDLARAVSGNPFAEELDPKQVHAVFFREGPGPDLAEYLAEAHQQARKRGGRDEARVVGDVLFLHTPDGFGRSDLAALLLGKSRSPAAVGTARNWATVTKLLALCDE